jgi:glycosyltransferase involved in cell wall biosynthesis
MSRPLVSVVMSVYNEEGYLKDTIDSILAQTLSDFEFIIVNDGSTDSTQDILESYAKIDCRIKLTSNNENLGVSKASNLGIEKARGKYIAIIDAGDIANNKRLEKQFDYLEANKEIYVLGTQGRWIDEEKRPIGNSKMPLVVSARDIYRTGGAIHPSVMMRRELFDIIGPYDEGLSTSQEFDLNMRTLSAGLGMANLEDELVWIMERNRGMTLKHLKTIQWNQFMIKAKYLPGFPSIWNVVYTARSLAGYLLPTFILMRLIKLLRRR